MVEKIDENDGLTVDDPRSVTQFSLLDLYSDSQQKTNTFTSISSRPCINPPFYIPVTLIFVTRRCER